MSAIAQTKSIAFWREALLFRRLGVCCKYLLVCGLASLVVLAAGTANAAAFKVLYYFKGGSDGSRPRAGLTMDGQGNLYGTTMQGGAHDAGTVFKLAPDGTETILHSFGGENDGLFPQSSLIADGAGNFYGTTESGGAGQGGADDGTVFKLAKDGTETILHTFSGGHDGAVPDAGLVADSAGNFYGTTSLGGGTASCPFGTGCGTVFKLAPDGQETVLHSFGGRDGALPYAGVILDKAGNLYGTTSEGGATDCQDGVGCGIAFKLSPDGTETVLHVFEAGTDGAFPYAGLTADEDGNLYGTTLFGGGGAACDEYGCGTVFKLAPDGSETILHTFTIVDRAGGEPSANLILDRKDNLYGTTVYGAAFKLTPDGIEHVLHVFHRKYGYHPYAGLIADGMGNLYGTTADGGDKACRRFGCGTVFEVIP